MTDYEKIDVIVDYLLEAYDKENPNYQAAEPFLRSIKKFYMNYMNRYRYSYSDFCDWLAGRNGDILINFKNADIVSKEDYKNSDDWEKAKKNAFLVSDDGTAAVMSWQYPAL